MPDLSKIDGIAEASITSIDEIAKASISVINGYQFPIASQDIDVEYDFNNSNRVTL